MSDGTIENSTFFIRDVRCVRCVRHAPHASRVSAPDDILCHFRRFEHDPFIRTTIATYIVATNANGCETPRLSGTQWLCQNVVGPCHLCQAPRFGRRSAYTGSCLASHCFQSTQAPDWRSAVVDPQSWHGPVFGSGSGVRRRSSHARQSMHWSRTSRLRSGWPHRRQYSATPWSGAASRPASMCASRVSGAAFAATNFAR